LGRGEPDALQELYPLVYGELRRLAHGYMSRERAGHTLETAALVNEAYLRLIESKRVRWQNRTQFFALSAQLMRRILVDFARARRSIKRGGEVPPLSLDHAPSVSAKSSPDLVALDDSLKALAEIDPRKSQVVELRFFGGLSVEETAEALKVSPGTVVRDWRLAKAWLRRELDRQKEYDA
jgi:RNA polymerase sigma factor (TIGR02999 family)